MLNIVILKNQIMKIGTNQILPFMGVSLFSLIAFTPSISIAQLSAQLNSWKSGRRRRCTARGSRRRARGARAPPQR